MNNILEMIKNEKVEWKKLGDVCEFNRGQTITKKKVRRGNIPVIAGGKKPAYYHNEFNREGETITVAGSGAYAGFLGYWEESIFLSDAFSIDPNSELIKKYLYYYLSSIQNKIYDLQRGAGVQHVYGKDMSNFIIPIPSLKTQEKIVEILDKFVKYSTELQAELQAELQNRSSQYEYFRDLVLSEDYLNKLSIESYKEKNNKIIIKTLDDIAQINRGSSPRPISRYITEENDGVPWIKIGDAGKNSKYITKTNQKITKEGAKKSRVLKKGDFIISNSMSYGRPYILDLEGAIHDGWASISDYDSVLDSNYLYHYLNTSFVQKYWENKMNSSSVSNLNIEIIKSLPIPILTKDLQLKVSSVLDKFQDLLAETEGLLPKEIEQRQKQYEYFREKLLTFDKDVVSQPASQPAVNR